MAEEVNQSSYRSFTRENGERFKKHFPPDLDEQSAVLRAHLLIEAMLRDFCVRSVPNPTYLEKARLSFSQISWLARSMDRLPISVLDYMWNLVAMINSLRNVMAHELEPDQAKMDGLCRSIIEMINDNYSGPNAAVDSLKGAVCYLCGLVDARLAVALAMNDPELLALGIKSDLSSAAAVAMHLRHQ